MPYKDKEKELEKHRRWQRNHRPQLAVKQAAYYKKNPKIYLLCACRARAKKNGILFNLVKEDLVIPKYCPVLGIPLFHGSLPFQDNSPSIDRLDPNKGYVPGNIAVISFRANRMKVNASLAEVKLLAQWMESELNPGPEIFAFA